VRLWPRAIAVELSILAGIAAVGFGVAAAGFPVACIISLACELFFGYKLPDLALTNPFASGVNCPAVTGGFRLAALFIMLRPWILFG